MGKGTILASLGEGRYLVKLLRDINRLLHRIEVTEGQIADAQARIPGLESAVQSALSELEGRKADIAALIAEAREANQHLVDALQAAIDALTVATEAADDAMAAMVSFIEQRRLTLQSYDESLAALREDLEAAETEEQRAAIQQEIDDLQAERDGYETQSSIDLQALRDDLTAKRQAQTAAAKTAQGAQEAYDRRDQKIKEITEAIADVAPLESAYRAAVAKLADEQLRLTGLVKDLQWMNANKGSDPQVSAWCADLTTDLQGTVATIEIPGERQDDVPVLIRPGYEDRSDYQQAEQHEALVAAVAAAKRAIVAAELALGVARANAAEIERQLADLQRKLEAAENKTPPAEAGYLASLRAQVEAAELALETIEASIPGLETAVSDAEAARDQAEAALAAARAAYCAPDHDPEPRMADGQLQPAASSNPWATFWNQALLPAWQKWKPMYRLGEILSLSGDTCTVRLDAAHSSQQNISVNRAATLYGVPIQYMECNGAAFSVGDRVVVEFRYHDQTKPLVIGFEREPKQCGYYHGIIITPCSSLSPEGWGDPLNGDPWGTPGVAPGHYVEMVDPPYTGASGGKGTQALLTWESDSPGGAKRLRMRHGAEWFPGVDMTKAVESRSDHAAGGHIAVTRPLTAEDLDENGALKKGVKVYSLDRPWLSTRKGFFALDAEDLLEAKIHLPFYTLCQFFDWRTGKTYRNGQFWQSDVMKSIGLVGGDGNQIIGIGVHKGDDGQEYLRIIVKSSRLIVGEFEYEDTSFLYSMQLDPPDYSSVSAYSEILRCDELARNFFLMSFNENATEAIGVGWALRKRVLFVREEYTLEPDIVRCTFADSGAGAFTHIKNPGIYGEQEHVDIEWPIAAGYCGNTEKILRYHYTFDHVVTEDVPNISGGFAGTAITTETNRYTINDRQIVNCMDESIFDIHYEKHPIWYKNPLIVEFPTDIQSSTYFRLLAVDFINEVLYHIRDKRYSKIHYLGRDENDQLPSYPEWRYGMYVYANEDRIADIIDRGDVGVGPN